MIDRKKLALDASKGIFEDKDYLNQDDFNLSDFDDRQIKQAYKAILRKLENKKSLHDRIMIQCCLQVKPFKELRCNNKSSVVRFFLNDLVEFGYLTKEIEGRATYYRRICDD